MNKYYVYTYTDPERDIPFYVGKGTGNRLMHHVWKKTQRSKPMHNKLRNLEERGLEPLIEIYKDGLTEDEAYQLEERLIQYLGRRYVDGGFLVNITPNGRPPNNKGRKTPEDVKLKISATKLGKPRPGLTWNKGRKRSETHGADHQPGAIVKKRTEQVVAILQANELPINQLGIDAAKNLGLIHRRYPVSENSFVKYGLK